MHYDVESINIFISKISLSWVKSEHSDREWIWLVMEIAKTISN